MSDLQNNACQKFMDTWVEQTYIIAKKSILKYLECETGNDLEKNHSISENKLNEMSKFIASTFADSLKIGYMSWVVFSKVGICIQEDLSEGAEPRIEEPTKPAYVLSIPSFISHNPPSPGDIVTLDKRLTYPPILIGKGIAPFEGGFVRLFFKTIVPSKKAADKACEEYKMLMGSVQEEVEESIRI